MEDSHSLFDWKSALLTTFQELTQQVIAHLPQLVGALFLLLVGWIIAYAMRLVTQKLFFALDKLVLQRGRKGDIAASPRKPYGKIGGNIVFWVVLLFFFAAAARLLDVQLISGGATAVIAYLPNLFAGLMVILAGFALSGITRSAVAEAAASAELENANILARVAQLTLLLTAILIGIEQLGIHLTFLTTSIIVVLGVLLAGAALAFGLGAQTFIANIIGARSAHKSCPVGYIMKIDGIEGRVLEITDCAIVLDTERGRALIPASMIHHKSCEIVADAPEDSGSFLGQIFQKKGDADEVQ